MNDKVCTVCGDRAIGHNFGALTCESCRSFFRRNATRFEEFGCFFGDNCEVNRLTRKFCKKCRIDRCLANGMKKEALTYGENNDSRRYRRKRPKNGAPIVSVTDEHKVEGCLTLDKFISKSNGQSSDEYNKDYHRDYLNATTESGLNELNVNTNSDSIIGSVIRGLIFNFNELEINRFKELFNSLAVVRGNPVTTIAYETNTASDGIQLIQNRADLKFTRMVKMSTNINGFKELCEDDKIVLLKAGCPQLWLLQNIVDFDVDGQFWRIPIDEENATLLRMSVLEGWSNVVIQSHWNFMSGLRAECNVDMNLIDLLSSIALFNPDLPNLVHKHSIILQRKTYMYLLQRYLETKHNSKSESETRFVRLMNCLRVLYVLTQLVLQHFGKALIHPIRVTPLVQEIFETKSLNGS